MDFTRYALIHTEWGVAAVVGSRRGLSRLVWPQPSAEAARRLVGELDRGAAEASAGWPGGAVADHLAAYFAGRPVEFADVAVDLSGQPPFFAAALAELRKVPYGRTISYGELARRLGRPGAARAVGQAMAANTLPVILPCHRVLRSDGGLGGFSAGDGTALKRRLLAMEAAGERS